MLARSHRLRRSQDIEHVLRRGRCISTRFVRVCVVPGSTPSTRIACVVGKRVHARAVRRHQYQRWLREIARDVVKRLATAQSYDMVWVGTAHMAHARDRAQVQQSLAALPAQLARLKL